MEKKTAIEIYEERQRIRLQRQKDRPAEQERKEAEWTAREIARQQAKKDKSTDFKKALKEFGSKMRWNKETKAWGPAAEAQSEPVAKSPAAEPAPKPPAKPKTYAQQRRVRMRARLLGYAPPIEEPLPVVYKAPKSPVLLGGLPKYANGTAHPTPPRRKYENEKMRNKARMDARLQELKDELK